MGLIDAVFWGVLCVGGIALSIWHGRSWRAVSRALADAERPAVRRPPAPAPERVERAPRTLCR